ncbi:hypothetical protein B0T14DRAFT_563934 [Immersiella caudata]|uniref:Uncharacterized protein n=1 Tax=Immersiella caudata TaxID=314043 RepID=A0AA39WVS5_9PEZI|nr:hypothetical protein B0T14DRAFT_563934 [Immersiella caudata]
MASGETPSNSGPAAAASLPTLFFGVFLGVFVFALSKIVGQTTAIWRRTKNLANAYLVMIWVEASVNLIFALLTFLYMPFDRLTPGFIPGTLALYIVAIILWAIQTQLLTQIIINRVALIMMTSQTRVRLLRWSFFGVIACINISVGYILISAALDDATPAQKRLNFIFEHIQKSFFLVVDLGLNLFFLYLVRTRLIDFGLTKYWRLYNFNAWIVTIATSMDVIPLGMLSHSNPFLYVQFTPLGYIIKLHIELTMAVLISKVVKSPNFPSNGALYSGVVEQEQPHAPALSFPVSTMTGRDHAGGKLPVVSSFAFGGRNANQGQDPEAGGSVRGSGTASEGSSRDGSLKLEGGGIVKTVQMTVAVNRSDGGLGG